MLWMRPENHFIAKLLLEFVASAQQNLCDIIIIPNPFRRFHLLFLEWALSIFRVKMRIIINDCESFPTIGILISMQMDRNEGKFC